jgi:hypothetical protein
MKTKTLAKLSYSLIVAISICLLFQAFFFVTAFFENNSYKNLPSNNSIIDIIPSEKVVYIVSTTQMITILLMFILFLFWVYNINKNLNSFDSVKMYYNPTWAVAWFFIPIAFFYKPFHVIEEIWDKTSEKYSNTVKLWWLLVLSSTFLGKFIINLLLRLFNTDQYNRIFISYTITDGLGVFMYIVFILMIKEIMKGYIIKSNDNFKQLLK